MCACVLVQVRGAVKWAAAEDLQVELDRQVEAFLGPKTEDDLLTPDKKKKKKVCDRLVAGFLRLRFCWQVKGRLSMLVAEGLEIRLKIVEVA